MRYGLIFIVSFLNLLYERAWSAFWPALTVLFAYAALALFNVTRMFGDAGAALLFAGFAAAFAFTLVRFGGAFRFPSAQDVERRMEEAGALTHRPLAALRDAPAGEVGAETRHLWDRHVRGLAFTKKHLKIAPARSDVARRDRYALRHAAMILLLIGIVVAGHDAETRLRAGLMPPIAAPAAAKTAQADVWITPPAYTRLPPVFLASSQKGMAVAQGLISAPEGSILKARVEGSARPPRLRFAGQSYAFTKASAKSWFIAMPLAASGTLRLRQGVAELGAWQVAAVPDAAPGISIVSAEKTAQALLKITYKANDDYGIAKLTGTVTPPASLPPGEDTAISAFDMSPPAQGAAEGTFTVDLTAHSRAGEPALLSLTATDSAGHSATSADFPFTLPERIFTNPTAQRIVAERRKVPAAKDGIARKAIADTLAAIGGDLSLYKGDITVFMSLGSAVRRLVYDGGPEARKSVQALLWDVALRLEDNGMTTAARDLGDALQQLSQSLDDKNATPQDLQKQLDAVNKLMQEYMRSFMAEIQQRLKNGQNMPILPPQLAQKFMKNIDLGEMLREMQQLSHGDSREAMKRMAEQLKKTLDSLSMDNLTQMKSEQMQAMEGLQELDEIIKRQQALVDKTGRLAPSDKGKDEAAEQSALRGKLGEAMRKIGDAVKEIPDNFAKADQAMKDAEKALGSGAPQSSLPHQKEALTQLQQGMDGAAEQMAKGMQQSILSFGFAPGGGQYGPGSDPLGRASSEGQGRGGDIELPAEKERRRVQEIIDELRSRSNEYERPKVERDYIDRLLDQMN